MQHLSSYLRHLNVVLRRRPKTVLHKRQVLTFIDTQLPHGVEAATADELATWQERTARYSTETVINYVATLRGYYGWLRETGRRDDNPAEVLVAPRAPRRLPRPIAEDDLVTGILCAPPDIRIALVLAGWAGLRCAEICNLEKGDITRTPRTLLMVRDGKGGRDRGVPAGQVVMQELARYGLPATGPVLRRRDGEPGRVTPNRLSFLVSDHLHGLGIASSLHKARHRFASLTYQASRDLLMVQDLMGHESPQTTAGYAAWGASSADTAVAALDATWPLRDGTTGGPSSPRLRRV